MSFEPPLFGNLTDGPRDGDANMPGSNDEEKEDVDCQFRV